MSNDVGVVLIWPPQAAPPDLSELLSDSAWTGAEQRREHPGLGASLTLQTVPTGFTLATVRIPSKRFVGEQASAATQLVRDVLDGAGRTGAGLGWVSRYAQHVDPDWIEEHVLVPWLAELFTDLVRPAWTAVFVGPALAGKLPRHPDWTTLVARDSGHVYLADSDLNPFAEGVA